MKLIFLFLSILIPAFAQAQGENNFWAFGHNVGLDFNQNPPTIFQTPLQCWEGGSVFFSDPAGNALFYSNGNDVWDANNNIMPNGSGIEGNGPASPGFPCSAAQGTVAAQSILNPNQYYLFTLDAVESVPPYGLGKLRYSVVDMSLNGGLGDVVVGQKNITLEDSLCEKMVLIPGNGCGYWLVVHHVNKAIYYTFKVDAGGVSPVPVVSYGIIPGLMGIGMMAVSPDSRRITLSNYMSGFEMGTFDNVTGVISNVGQFTGQSQSGMSAHCFSSDNTKLYLGRNSRLTQYDVTLFPNMVAVEASAVEIATGSNAPFGYMRRGPNNKIYAATYTNPSIAVINSPNDAGLACDYDLNGIPLPPFAQFPNPASPPNPYYGLGVGQTVLSARNLVEVGPATRKDTVICPGEKVTFSVPQGRNYYRWNNGNTTNSLTPTGPGTYWVRSWQGCRVYSDTFVLKVVALDSWAGLGNDTTLCPGAGLTLNAFAPGIDHYRWQDGSTDTTYTVTQAGQYSVRADVNGCMFYDTIHVTLLDPYVDILQNDTTVCHDLTIALRVIASPESSYRWNTGETGAVLLVKAPGIYAVEALNQCGTYTDSVRINMVYCDCRSFVPNAFSPNGDGHNDVFEWQLNCPSIEYFAFSVYNRYGQKIFHTEDPGQKWDGTSNGKLLDTGTYFYYLKYKAKGKEAITRKGDITLIR